MEPKQTDRPDVVTARSKAAASSAITSFTKLWPARLVAYLIGMMLIVVLTRLISLPFVPASSSPVYEPFVTIRNILQTAAMIAFYAFLVRKLEHRIASETAIRGAVIPLLTGITIGVGMIAMTYLVLYALGLAQFRSGTGVSGIVTAMLKPAVIGTLEELIFRIILFRILQHMSGTALAVIVSAGLFGLADFGNPGATPLTMTFLAIEMGVFLALVYVLTQSLWVIAGSHMGWNFALGFIFGSDVSGRESPNAVFVTTLKGPDLLTGGAFGPEGSIVTLGVSLMAIFVSVWLISRKDLWQPAKFAIGERRLSASV